MSKLASIPRMYRVEVPTTDGDPTSLPLFSQSTVVQVELLYEYSQVSAEDQEMMGLNSDV